MVLSWLDFVQQQACKQFGRDIYWPVPEDRIVLQPLILHVRNLRLKEGDG